MSGLTRHGRISKYTDESGDGFEISASQGDDGRPVVALVPVLDAGGELVHLAVDDLEDVIAALREKAAEAQAEYSD